MAKIPLDLGNIDNTLTLANENYLITGTDGNNTLTIGGGNDQLTLGNGNNTLTLGSGTDQITAGAGNNTITTSGVGIDTITLTDGNNTLSVGDGANVILAGNGLNTVTAGDGNDTITLGNGFDQVTAGNGNSAIIVGNGVGDTVVVGTGSNTIALGTGSADVVHTGSGNNAVTVTAAAVGADTIQGGLTSGDGSQNRLGVTTAGIIDAGGVSGFEIFQLANGGSNGLTLTNANFARLPGASITVLGGNSGNTVDASALSAANAVFVHAGTGTNALTGGAGNDTFYSAPGTTTVDGGAGVNTMIYAGARSSYNVTVIGTDTLVVGAGSTDTLRNIQDIRFTEAPPAALGLAPASDSGVSSSDIITNVAKPTITGNGEAGATVALLDAGTAIGTGTVNALGVWSIAATTPLTEGANTISATQTNTAGDISAASATLSVTLDTTAPIVSAALANPAGANPNDINYSQALDGGGDPNTIVTVSEGGQAVGTAQANATGAWSFGLSSLAQGVHTLVASETDTAGNTGLATPLVTANTRFALTDVTTHVSGSVPGSDYTGPVSYLQAQYFESGLDNMAASATVANVFMHGNSGDDAFAAKAGSNVLDGGTGSNWLVGATGADGGHDTFFLDGRGSQPTWDTLLNFHSGDSLTLWGFDKAASDTHWLDNQGAAGYHGATLQVDLGPGSGASALVTFAGLTTNNAQFVTSTGASGGLNYLAVTRIA